MGDNKYWILGLGGVGIGVGLLLYGSQILRAIGVKLAVITPSRGFCIEMGSSTVVILGAYYGLPLSTTHCQVGATIGVALLEGVRGCNTWVMAKTAFGWVFTCVFVGTVAGLLTAWGAYAPTARYPDIVFVNTTV
jgi:sodium-dependent phosphate transporter